MKWYLFCLPAGFLLTVTYAEEHPIDIGTRRELFVDSLLIGEHRGTQLKLHTPTKVKRSLTNRPFGHYATVLQDEGKFRLYYRGDIVKGMHWREDGWGPYHENEVTLYAESDDGYQWELPDLGLHDIPEIPEGNVVLAHHFLVTHNFTPFIDQNPDKKSEEKYKAMGGGRYPDKNWSAWPDKTTRQSLIAKHGPGGLYAYSSPDGINWKRMSEEPVIPESFGNFDSQNVAFWSEPEKQYVLYFRYFRNGLRSIRRSTSTDFLTWNEPVEMEANQPGEHLYTNGTQPYFRAPHIYLALPTRFQTNRGSITDIALMAARPGSTTYERVFRESFIRPGLGADGWGNRSNYIALNVVPTSRNEISLLMYGGDHYTLRTDGFVSIHAGYDEGEFLTKPFLFSGDRFEINYSTSSAGMMRFELQDAAGQTLPGFSLDESAKIWGDEIQRYIKWNKSEDVSAAAGKPVRLRVVMNEADLFSIRFPKAE